MTAKLIGKDRQTVWTERTCPDCGETKPLSSFYSTQWAQNKEHVSTSGKLQRKRTHPAVRR